MKIFDACMLEKVYKSRVYMSLLGAINVECSNQGKSKVVEQIWWPIPLEKVLSKLNTLFTPQVQCIDAINSTECREHRPEGSDIPWQNVEGINRINTPLVKC